MRRGTSIAVFGMLERGHVSRLLPIVSGLARAGVLVHVYTDARFREDVERSGGRFEDLFAGRPLDAADATSVPIPCRYVSFAGCYADAVAAQVAALRPSLVVHDTFAVIGAVVARRLGLRRVNVCVGHNHAPEPTLEALRDDPRVAVSDDCRRAVQALRERHQMPDASPFSYVTAISPDLNVYCEPPQFLNDDERAAFEPLIFFGSLSEQALARTAPAESPFGEGCAASRRVYVSFGTVIWRYYEPAARIALQAISEAVGGLPDAVALVSMGRAPLPWAAALERSNVRVQGYVDQWSALREASVFVTHQGLNSTHEAIFQGVPMVSYPFFADQPALSRRCQGLGLAVPLSAGLRAPVSPDDVRSALARVEHEREGLRARLAKAREWEQDVIAARGQAVSRILALLP